MRAPRERQELDRLRDRLAKGWAAGLSTQQIGARLGLSKGATVGIIARARAHGDGRFRPRPISSGRDHLKGEPRPPPSEGSRAQERTAAITIAELSRVDGSTPVNSRFAVSAAQARAA